MLGAKGLAETSAFLLEDREQEEECGSPARIVENTHPWAGRCRQLLGEFMMSGRLLGRAALAQAFRTALRSVTIGGLQFFRCN